MCKEDEHIINWILKKTDLTRQSEHFNTKKRASAFDQRKRRIDDTMFYCEKCRNIWSYVSKYIDDTNWRKYPKGLIPTIGKKRKECGDCEKIF